MDHWDIQRQKRKKKEKETEEKGRKGQVTAAVSRVRTRTLKPALSRGRVASAMTVRSLVSSPTVKSPYSHQ